MNQKQGLELIETIKSGFKTSGAKADDRVIIKMSYEFDLGGGIEIGEALNVAVAYVNDQEVAAISFAEGDPNSKTIEVDVSGAVIPDEYNVFRLESYVLKDYFGFDISSEAEYSLKVRGNRVVKEKFKTNAMIRLVNETWIALVPYA